MTPEEREELTTFLLVASDEEIADLHKFIRLILLWRVFGWVRVQ